jgi:hypothetical protein
MLLLLSVQVSACGVPSCDLSEELAPGEACPGGVGLFVHCPDEMVCCYTPGSDTPTCSQIGQCRLPGAGEECDLNFSIIPPIFGKRCEGALTCSSAGICACEPACYTGHACLQDESTCSFECCESDRQCVAGTCVAAPDSGSPDAVVDAGADDAQGFD